MNKVRLKNLIFVCVFVLILPLGIGFMVQLTAAQDTEPELVLFLAGATKPDSFKDISPYNHPIRQIGYVEVSLDPDLGRNVFKFKSGYLAIEDDLNGNGIQDIGDGLLNYYLGDSLTIEINVKITNPQIEQILFFKGSLEDDNVRWFHRFNYEFQNTLADPWGNGNYDPYLGFGLGQCTSGSLTPDTEWKVYTFMIQPAQDIGFYKVTIYVNGQMITVWDTYRLGQDLADLSPLYIGNGFTTGGAVNLFTLLPFFGSIDYIRIYRGLLDWEELNNDPYNDVPFPPSNQGPVAICQDFTTSAGSDCLAQVSPEDVNAGSSDPDGDIITFSLDNLGPFSLGVHTVKLTVEDEHGATDFCTATVTVVDETAPVPDAPALPDVVGECSATVTSAPTATDNCAGSITGTTTDPLEYTQQGIYTITWSFDDGNGNVATQTQAVVVQDTIDPIMGTLTADPDKLWPPNHKMVPVVISGAATDNCDPNPQLKIVDVSSNQPINGLGDGDTSPDWEITGDMTLLLRAERAGVGSERIYTITVQCTDYAGNVTTNTVEVNVPKSLGQGSKKGKSGRK